MPYRPNLSRLDYSFAFSSHLLSKSIMRDAGIAANASFLINAPAFFASLYRRKTAAA
jgi:hypothetical protein